MHQTVSDQYCTLNNTQKRVKSSCQIFVSNLRVKTLCQIFGSNLRFKSSCQIFISNLRVKSSCQIFVLNLLSLWRKGISHFYKRHFLAANADTGFNDPYDKRSVLRRETLSHCGQRTNRAGIIHFPEILSRSCDGNYGLALFPLTNSVSIVSPDPDPNPVFLSFFHFQLCYFLSELKGLHCF